MKVDKKILRQMIASIHKDVDSMGKITPTTIKIKSIESGVQSGWYKVYYKFYYINHPHLKIYRKRDYKKVWYDETFVFNENDYSEAKMKFREIKIKQILDFKI